MFHPNEKSQPSEVPTCSQPGVALNGEDLSQPIGISLQILSDAMPSAESSLRRFRTGVPPDGFKRDDVRRCEPKGM